jgi:hypothetical protein
MYRFLDRLSPEDVQAIAAFAYMQMLEAVSQQSASFNICTTTGVASHTMTSVKWRKPLLPLLLRHTLA